MPVSNQAYSNETDPLVSKASAQTAAVGDVEQSSAFSSSSTVGIDILQGNIGGQRPEGFNKTLFMSLLVDSVPGE